MQLHRKAVHVVDGLLFEGTPNEASKSRRERKRVLLRTAGPQRVARPVHAGQHNMMLACAAANPVLAVAFFVQGLITQTMPAPNTGALLPSRSELAKITRELAKTRGFSERLEKRGLPQQGCQGVLHCTRNLVTNATTNDRPTDLSSLVADRDTDCICWPNVFEP